MPLFLPVLRLSMQSVETVSVKISVVTVAFEDVFNATAFY